MDSVTLVVTAVALGAAAGMQDTATAVVKDAYAGLKILLSRRNVDVSPVERKPDSPEKQASLREDLADLEGTPDAVDEELVDAARRVVGVVKVHDAAAGAAIGIDLEEFEAASLRVSRVSTEGTAVRGAKWKITGDAVFEDIHAGRPTAGSSVPPEGGEDDPPR